MKFEASGIDGCIVVDIEPHEDDRGLFARTWCSREFSDVGLPGTVVQCSLSRNTRKGTLRGLHFQLPPSREAKLVRCSRGVIVDVVVDIRPGSETFLKSISLELSEKNCRALFIPPGCAHGFQTLVDDCDVFYQMTDYYAPALGAGLRWNDPRLDINWPLPDPVLNERDGNYADFDMDWLQSLDWGANRQ